ncbi:MULTISPECIES: OmpA/MotB family protein [Aestuariibaculum]|uniref:Flagellar motor protein MotB n=1 Tax=Aestuariibaculum lutulentum TaxID=2920935 RepID=A0ABS9RI39_9FLAO|nr:MULTISPECIES: flagellar motor protein MotB [Aestuariibaculum]MCH4552608.1 flagellar motor protein MotB [Aestuariibaculum lutulentum]MCR8668158.1 flagellar motor protein MotB [Aestuariibaculum sp. M13]
MRKVLLFGASAMLVLSSCVSKKQFTDLEAKYKESQDLLNSATVKLNSCLEERASASARAKALEEQVSDLRNYNENLQVLSAKGASNIEKTLESMKEKDLKITRLQDALTKKDSVTLALVTSLKREVGINDPDIEVNVEKGVVYISIADKLLFKSGSYNVTSQAKDVLAKVAKVVNSKPDFECMVEGHTDNVPYKSNGVILDNWDLSVKRATSVVRVLEDLGVNPSQLVAAGRADYVPLVENNTSENRARNRRTRILVLPKIDQFYDMIEKEMKNMEAGN